MIRKLHGRCEPSLFSLNDGNFSLSPPPAMAEEAIPTPRYRVVKQNGLGNLAKLSIYGFVIKRFFCKRIYIKGELLMK